MKEKWKGFLFLPALLTAEILAKCYLFPEILAPDCIRVVYEEPEAKTGMDAEDAGYAETDAEAGYTETDPDLTKEGSEAAEPEKIPDREKDNFRFYDSPYRIAWKFF